MTIDRYYEHILRTQENTLKRIRILRERDQRDEQEIEELHELYELLGRNTAEIDMYERLIEKDM